MFRKWFEAKSPTTRWRGRRFAAAALLAGALTGGPAWALSIERAPAPEGSWSLGSADVYVEIRDLGGKSQSVSIPMSESEVRWLDQGSLRLQWWNPDKKRFELVDGSRYDAGKKAMQSTVSKDGRYGVFGWSAWSHIRSVQGQLCDPSEILSDQLINELCLVILCPAYDTMAWSEAWFEGTGQRVPPGDVGEHFGNLCDQCIGRPAGPVNPAECGGGGGNPQPGPGGVPPPELEQIPNGIDEGGRAVAIAVRPGDDDEMIVASETGGLFATEDRGDTWRHVSYDTTFDFSDVQYLPSHPDVVVASAQRDTRVASGGGIWRSADGGETWAQVALTPPLTSCVENLGAYALELDSNGTRLWAGTTCGLAYSDDGASTWSFLPAVTGYTHGKVYSVAAPAVNQLKILTDGGVRVTTNGGGSWTVSSTGLPAAIGLIGKAVHNQIAASPRNPSHLYFAFPYWDATWNGRTALYRSIDNGASWSVVLDEAGLNRMPHVRVSKPLSGNSNQYHLYFSTGGCFFKRSTVTHGAAPTLSAWQELHTDHCDPADLAFANDGVTPLLLASDGGLHKTEDNGLHWTLTGGVRSGYNALQITEITGQQHRWGDLADLYFATQDNGIWASPDFGRTWPGSTCCEGFFLSVPREPLPDEETKVSGVACGACFNFMGGRLLRDVQNFPNAPNGNGNPKLLKPGAYVQSTQLPGVDDTLYSLTLDNGGVWTPRYGFPEPPQSMPQLAGPAANPTLFTAVKTPGVTPTGQERVSIKRITGVLGSGTPVVSQVNNFGSLGTFATMFAWYKPFGVDVADPNFFLAPDIVDAVVKKSADGGMTWAPDAALTQLVTGAGTFRFRWDEFVQTSSFGFDPTCPGHILVGTTQAGVLRSYNGGGTWERVSGTERIPRVSSFYFAEDGNAVLSSYGRGLWRLRYTCPNTPRNSGFRAFPDPLVYDRGTIFPLRAIDDPVTCPQCVVLMTRGGEVLEYVLNPEGEVKQVVLSAGSLAAYASNGKEIAVPVEVRFGTSRKLPPDSRLASLLAAGNRVQGLTLEGRSFKGLLVAAEQAGPEDLPVAKVLNPYVVVSVPSTHGVGVSRLRTIEIVGHGFDPKVSITLTLDGAPITVKPVFDDKGIFRVLTPAPLAVGGHIVRAEQKVGLTTWRDAYSFNVTVEDEEEEE